MAETNLHGDNPQSSHRKIASYLAAASATVIQTTSTHALDTVTKRLQNNNSVNLSLRDPRIFFTNLYKVIYPTPSSSVWNGYKAALTHRIVASTLTFGSQPLLKNFIEAEYGSAIGQLIGEHYKSTATHMISGSVFGLVEVAFLPLDRAKVLLQTNTSKPFFELFKQPLGTLYAGSCITALRNIKSFTVLYGMSDVVNGYFQHDGKQDSLSFSQRLVASGAAATAAVLASNPADVIKTRIQAQTNSGDRPDSAVRMGINIYRQHGAFAFWRGACPRLGSLVPRLTLLKSLSDELVPVIDRMLSR